MLQAYKKCVDYQSMILQFDLCTLLSDGTVLFLLIVLINFETRLFCAAAISINALLAPQDVKKSSTWRRNAIWHGNALILKLFLLCGTMKIFFFFFTFTFLMQIRVTV